jgi:DNA invertase Pin-like site-specific DNA recombinase
MKGDMAPGESHPHGPPPIVLPATEAIDDTSTGNMMEGVLTAFPQFDNDLRSERTHPGMRVREQRKAEVCRDIATGQDATQRPLRDVGW